MAVGEPKKGLDELELCSLWYVWISKEVDCGSINNGLVWGKFLAGDLVEEAEVNIKASTWI